MAPGSQSPNFQVEEGCESKAMPPLCHSSHSRERSRSRFLEGGGGTAWCSKQHVVRAGAGVGTGSAPPSWPLCPLLSALGLHSAAGPAGQLCPVHEALCPRRSASERVCLSLSGGRQVRGQPWNAVRMGGGTWWRRCLGTLLPFLRQEGHWAGSGLGLLQ